MRNILCEWSDMLHELLHGLLISEMFLSMDKWIGWLEKCIWLTEKWIGWLVKFIWLMDKWSSWIEKWIWRKRNGLGQLMNGLYLLRNEFW